MDKRMVKKEPNKNKFDKIFDFFLKSAPLEKILDPPLVLS